MDSCLFCRIAAGDIPSTAVYGDESYYAFRDIAPGAPTHILVIPRRHVAHVADLDDGDADLLGGLMTTAIRLAAEAGLADDGYRLVINNGRDGGQSVDHLHLHILGGRSMTWPPG